jgi:phosphohistidine phosphatase
VDLYVVRHAVAHKRDEGLWPDDAKRSLTPEGEERFPRFAEEILWFVTKQER